MNSPKTPDRPTVSPLAHQTFTPCTRLSRMTLGPATDDPPRPFQEGWMEEKVRGEERSMDKKRPFSFSEEEESDDDAFFSSDPCSPAHPFEEAMWSARPRTRQSLFEEEDEVDGHYDPSTAWLVRVYHDNRPQENTVCEEMSEEEVENRSPWEEREEGKRGGEDRWPLQEISWEEDGQTGKTRLLGTKRVIQTSSLCFIKRKRQNTNQ
ncbi:hypothetical protein G6F46_008575 [Rhizopus delemar]|uniref:Uncharacterized protein n=3 Tax=Rhizopus TaxID=4842 RepID=I1BRV1_RHIO9|nr:hypothetical protein RO3G_03636 [Rhizopus delemar RA 99-880]KAG1148257.1 hypothetical protein G6F36_014841 [Rhizopus arrhizus]KAG1450717.1 hypothetical protein G6F55_009551 [Rhizopus delemar]KAG1491497.1 hypothetical protein G6F54_009976 [Rhizopus delemar]KAG1505580.1 hypothetical protein G6F53_010154 [Rhizopus delemar]|eukprot:EIE78931.1 hypothetical protein RO3G_03636 [Rhizopus delemar RA 99-880]